MCFQTSGFCNAALLGLERWFIFASIEHFYMRPSVHWEMCPWNLCQLWGGVRSAVFFLMLPCSIKGWTNCKETPGWYWDGAQQVREQGERAQLDQPGEGMDERDLIVYTNLIRAHREDGVSLLSAVNTDNEKVTSCIKGNSKYLQGRSFAREGSPMLAEVAWQCWGVSMPGDCAPAWPGSQSCLVGEVSLWAVLCLKCGHPYQWREEAFWACVFPEQEQYWEEVAQSSGPYWRRAEV